MMILEQPALGQIRVANEMKKLGVCRSAMISRRSRSGAQATALPNHRHRNPARLSRRDPWLAAYTMARALTAGPLVKCIEINGSVIATGEVLAPHP